MLGKARDFITRNARLLERRRFAHAYEGGAAGDVVRALAAYRNADGGFGWGLEPDKRDPASQPVDAQVALEILDEVDAVDPAIAGGLCGWLMDVATKEGGVPFSLPSLNAWPHAPWWRAEETPPANLNPTAAIAGLLLKHRIDHPFVDQAVAFCWTALEKSDSAEFHELMPVLTLLDHVPDRARADRARRDILDRIAAPGVVEMDPLAKGYVKKPLDWAPRPDCSTRALFPPAVIAGHLKALAAQQQEDGGWPISWETVGPGVTLEWRGIVTLGALATLKAYGAG